MSIISVHSTFPAPLLHFQPLESSGLFDFNASRGQERVLEDGVTVSKDGLAIQQYQQIFRVRILVGSLIHGIR